MATINPTFTRINGTDESLLWTWPSLLTATTDGAPIEFAQHADLCWQAVGANWGSATLTIQGSNDGTNWFTLNKVAGSTATTFTADGGQTTIERPRYVRPKLTTAGTAADVTVTVHARKQPQMRF